MPTDHLDPCSECQRPIGGSYPTCDTCAETVDASWTGAWAQFVAEHPETAEPILVEEVLGHPERHAWAVVDEACWRSTCRSCRTPLGLGMPGCVVCDSIIEAVYAARADAGDARRIGPVEHDLRIARWLLRSPYRTAPGQAARWRSIVPALLARRSQRHLAAREPVRRSFHAR